MNAFERAEYLVETNKKIKAKAFDSFISYNPNNENLEPGKYAEHGYVKGQQDLLELMLEKRIITEFDLRKIWKD
jgi:hypothetical protein